MISAADLLNNCLQNFFVKFFSLPFPSFSYGIHCVAANFRVEMNFDRKNLLFRIFAV
jgi:hypothetical protein